MREKVIFTNGLIDLAQSKLGSKVGPKLGAIFGANLGVNMDLNLIFTWT